MGTPEAKTFAEKFEEALDEFRQREPGFGVRTIARRIAPDDPKRVETIRRRLNKYRPKKPSGGAAEVAPTEPTRHEIERAMGLPLDALKPDPLEEIAARVPLEEVDGEGGEEELPSVLFDRLIRAIVRDELSKKAVA